MMTRDEAAEIFRLMRQIRKIIKRGLYQNYRELPPVYDLPSDLSLPNDTIHKLSTAFENSDTRYREEIVVVVAPESGLFSRFFGAERPSPTKVVRLLEVRRGEPGFEDLVWGYNPSPEEFGFEYKDGHWTKPYQDSAEQ